MIKNKYAKLAVLFVVVMLIFAVITPFSAKAADDVMSLTLICKKEDKILTGMNWRLYYVGQRSGNGYALEGDFSNYSVTMEADDADSMNEAAYTLENNAILDQIKPIIKGQIDESGYLVFQNLKSGLYMVSGDIFNVGVVFYKPSVALVEIDTDNDENNVELVVYPKVQYALLSEINLNNTVTKVWNDNKETHDAVTVEIYKNAELFGIKTLCEENNWTYNWKTAEAAEWRVKESIVPENYTVKYESNNGKHTIENTFHGVETTTTTLPPQPEPPLPQTGQLWWPVFVMGGCGFIFIIIGIRINRKKWSKI